MNERGDGGATAVRSPVPGPRTRRSPAGARPLVVLLALLAMAGLIAACGAAAKPPASTIGDAATKVLTMRAVALNDIATLSTATDAVDVAADAIEDAAADASALVSQASDQVALAAPIAARARTDLVSYQHALTGVQSAVSAEPSAGTRISDDAADVVDLGSREVAAIRATTVDYAAEWPDLGRLSAAQQQWARHQKDATASAVAETTYSDSASSIDAALAPERARVAADEQTRGPATRAAAAALARLIATLPRDAVATPSPLPSPSLSVVPRPAETVPAPTAAGSAAAAPAATPAAST